MSSILHAQNPYELVVNVITYYIKLININILNHLDASWDYIWAAVIGKY